MSREEPDLIIDDLDVDQLSLELSNMKIWDLKVANTTKERDKAASIVARHLLRLTDAKGITLADHDINLSEKRFVPKVKPEVIDPPNVGV